MARPDPPLKPTVFCTSSNCSSNFSSLKHFIGKNGNSWGTITTHHNHELKYLNVLYCHNLPTSLLPQYKRTHTQRDNPVNTWPEHIRVFKRWRNARKHFTSHLFCHSPELVQEMVEKNQLGLEKHLLGHARIELHWAQSKHLRIRADADVLEEQTSVKVFCILRDGHLQTAGDIQIINLGLWYVRSQLQPVCLNVLC